jgi:hypothetical protein
VGEQDGDLPGAPDHPQKPVNVSIPLAMYGERHTLYVHETNGKLVVDIASRRDQLKRVVSQAIREEENGAQRPKLLNHLREINAELQKLIEFEQAGSYSLMPEDHIRQWTQAIANIIQGIGSEYKIKDLEHLGHPSIYVEGDELKEEYRSQVRDRFYPSDYWQSTETWKVQRLRQLTNPLNPQEFKDEITGKWEPKILNGKDNVTVDHTTMVVDHWNSEGHNTTQDQRAAFYNDTSKLRLTTSANNSSDGALARASGHVYSPKVGPNFRGSNDTKD